MPGSFRWSVSLPRLDDVIERRDAPTQTVRPQPNTFVDR
jgi:hypothetical protein